MGFTLLWLGLSLHNSAVGLVNGPPEPGSFKASGFGSFIRGWGAYLDTGDHKP